MPYLLETMHAAAPYWKQRAQDERATASAASSTEARKAHWELAFRYEKLASDLSLSRAAGGDLKLSPGSKQHFLQGRGLLGRVIDAAFPLPMSGTFADILEAIDVDEGQ